MSTPTPILNSVTPDNNSGLLCNWSNNPYVGFNNAYLLYVNTTASNPVIDSSMNYYMNYYYLTDAQAALESVTIPGLKAGDVYMIQYVQTQTAPDGVQGGSNTLTATPIQVNPPIIVNPVIVVGDFNADVTVIYQAGSDYAERLYIQIADETDKVMLSPFIQEFNGYPPAQDDEVTYQIGGLTPGHEYTVSSFLVTPAGMTILSNSVTFLQSTLPYDPVITDALSGEDAQITVTQLTVVQPYDHITHILFQVSVDNTQWNTVLDISGNDIPVTTTGQTITLNNVVLTSAGLTSISNGTGYYVRAYASNVNGDGQDSNTLTAVPALTPVVAASLTYTSTGVDASMNLTATFTPSDITFNLSSDQLTYTYTFYDPNLVVLSTGTTTTSGDTLSTSVQITVPPLVDWAHTYSVDVQLAELVPSPQLSFWTISTVPLTANSILSNTDTATVTPISQPGEITNLLSYPGNNSLTWTWTAPANPSYWGGSVSYRVQLYQGNNSSDPYSVPVGGPVTTPNTDQAFTGLTNNTNYWVSVTPFNSVGDGPTTSYPTAAGPSVYPLADPVAPTIDTIVQTGSDGVNIFATLTFTDPNASNSGYTNINRTLYPDPSSNVSFTVDPSNNFAYNLVFPYVANVTYTFTLDETLEYSQPSTVQPGPLSSTPLSFTTGLAPIILSPGVTFTTPAGQNTSVSFTVNNNGSALVTTDTSKPGIVLFALPDGVLSHPPVTYIPVYPSPNLPSTIYTYTYELNYVVDPTDTPYLLVVSNACGSGTYNAHL